MRSAEARCLIRSDRGVALLITLLVTTLLMALVFEFAYGTRVSLRAAVNFRDSQQAYFLARSGVNIVGKFLVENRKPGKMQDYLERRECNIPLSDMIPGAPPVRVCWEDEAGKINIANVSQGQQSLDRLERLFGIKQVGLDVVDRLMELKKVRLLGELHHVMSDEEFGSIRNFVTVWSGSDKIDINTAPSEVLQSIEISAPSAEMIIKRRETELFPDKTGLADTYGISSTLLGNLDVTSDVFFVQSYATVGGYTKHAEAVIKRSAIDFSIMYWKIL